MLAALPALLLVVIPLLALTDRARSPLTLSVLAESQTQQAILLSLQTTGIAILIVAIIGFPLAYFIVSRSTWLSRLADLVSDLPIVLPPAAAGIALLAAFGRQGWLGGTLDEWGIQVTFTSTAVVIAQIFVALPYFVRSVCEGLRQVNRTTLDAGSIDGASSWQLAILVHLPQCSNGLLAGVLLGWARALGEFGATLMFAGNFVGRTQTMPLAIYAGFESDLDVAVSLSIVLLVMALVILMAVRFIMERASPFE